MIHGASGGYGAKLPVDQGADALGATVMHIGVQCKGGRNDRGPGATAGRAGAAIAKTSA
jgi:hypothetical protein